MRDSSTVPGQACLSLFGDLCRQTLPPSKYMYLELGVWTHASATLRQSHAADRAFDFAQRAKYTCRVGVARKFRACAYVRCEPVRRTRHTYNLYRKILPVVQLGSMRMPINAIRVQNRTSFLDVDISFIQRLIAQSVSNLSGYKHISLKR